MSQGLCPSCGAAVNLTAGQIETKCQYCDNIVTSPAAEARFSEVKNSKAGGALLVAQQYLRGADYAKAQKFFDRAIEQDEKCAEAWFGKGVCHIRDSEKSEYDENPRIHGDSGCSAFDMAIQFAANPEAMAARAAMEIEYAVSVGLQDEEDRESFGMSFLYNDADFNGLLGWAIEKCSTNEKLIKTGVEFYRRAMPSAERNTGADFEREFANRLRANYTKYSKALERICPASSTAIAPGLQSSDMTPPVEIPPTVEALIRQGDHKKIAVIQELRSLRSGLGLAEAKKIVEDDGRILGTMAETQQGNGGAQGVVGCLMYGCLILLVFCICGFIVKSWGLNWWGPNPKLSDDDSSTIALFFVLSPVFAVIAFTLSRIRKNPSLSKKLLSKAAEGAAVAAVATGAVIENALTENKRNKPVTKGDLEDLKEELRRKERNR
jgi:hypothetical protein